MLAQLMRCSAAHRTGAKIVLQVASWISVRFGLIISRISGNPLYAAIFLRVALDHGQRFHARTRPRPAPSCFRKGEKTRYVPLHGVARDRIEEYFQKSGHGGTDKGALFRPLRNARGVSRQKAITPDGIYKLVRQYSAALGFEIGAHALRATAAINALDHQADIAKVQEWLGHSNIATTRLYDHRKTRPEDSPTFTVSY
jgi:integrase/recombinase XerD